MIVRVVVRGEHDQHRPSHAAVNVVGDDALKDRALENAVELSTVGVEGIRAHRFNLFLLRLSGGRSDGARLRLVMRRQSRRRPLCLLRLLMLLREVHGHTVSLLSAAWRCFSRSAACSAAFCAALARTSETPEVLLWSIRAPA